MKPRKRGGESMIGDRISKLPEFLILQILSLLPTKSAVATSVLSKHWQFLWKMMPKLRFDSCDHKGEIWTFSNNVCKTLLSHKAPVLESLHLNFSLNSCDTTDIGIWIGIAYAQHVRRLGLNVQCTGGQFIFPRSLYNCDILETLKLTGLFIIRSLPSQVCLKSLKTLQLTHTNNLSFVNLLPFFPNLENLLLHPHGSHATSSAKFTVTSPSLRRLSIYNCYVHCDCVINAPSLKYLNIKEDCIYGTTCRHEFRVIENVTTLVEANFIDFSHKINENFLISLTSVKRLSLELSLSKFPTSITFYELVHLELKTSTEGWWNLLTFMLSISPKLQVLKLIDNYCWRSGYKSKGDWKQPTKFPICLLRHLETFMWEGYNKWLVEEEKKMASYILENAYHLKRATFSLMSFEDKDELIKDLESMEWASASCERLFE